MLWLVGLASMIAMADIDKSIEMIEESTGCEIVVTSGHRTPKRNKEVGGAPNSYHLYDRARDFVLKQPECMKLSDIAGISCILGLNVIQYPRHIHIDNRNNPKCWSTNGN
jgi:uncharacterized protein YcbK (DUF882 family)